MVMLLHAFLQVAKTIDGIPFGITSNKDVLKELEVKKDTIVLLKKVLRKILYLFYCMFIFLILV